MSHRSFVSPLGDKGKEAYSTTPDSDDEETPDAVCAALTIDGALRGTGTGATVDGVETPAVAGPSKVFFKSPGSNDNSPESTGGQSFDSVARQRESGQGNAYDTSPGSDGPPPTFLNTPDGNTRRSTNRRGIVFSENRLPKPIAKSKRRAMAKPSPPKDGDTEEERKEKEQRIEAFENSEKNTSESREKQLDVWNGDFVTTPRSACDDAKHVVLLGIDSKVTITNNDGQQPLPRLKGDPSANLRLPGLEELRLYLAPNKEFEKSKEWRKIKEKVDLQEQKTDESRSVKKFWIRQMDRLAISAIREGGAEPNADGFHQVYIPPLVIHFVEQGLWYIQHGKVRMAKAVGNDYVVIAPKNDVSKVVRPFPLENAKDLVMHNIVSGNYLGVVDKGRKKWGGLLVLLNEAGLEINWSKVVVPMMTALYNKCEKVDVAATKGPEGAAVLTTKPQQSAMKKPKQCTATANGNMTSTTELQQSATKKPKQRTVTANDKIEDRYGENEGRRCQIVKARDEGLGDQLGTIVKQLFNDASEALVKQSKDHAEKQSQTVAGFTEVLQAFAVNQQSFAANQRAIIQDHAEHRNQAAEERAAERAQYNAQIEAERQRLEEERKRFEAERARLSAKNEAERARLAAENEAERERHHQQQVACLHVLYASNTEPRMVAALGQVLGQKGESSSCSDDEQGELSTQPLSVGNPVQIIAHESLFEKRKGYVGKKATVCRVMKVLALIECEGEKFKLNKNCLQLLPKEL